MKKASGLMERESSCDYEPHPAASAPSRTFPTALPMNFAISFPHSSSQYSLEHLQKTQCLRLRPWRLCRAGLSLSHPYETLHISTTLRQQCRMRLSRHLKACEENQ